jgi:hypothetical protein
LRARLGVQSAEPGPNEEVQDEKRTDLVERADEAIRRQAPQEQQLETAGKITKQSGAQTMPRRLGSRSGGRSRIVWRRVQRSTSRVPQLLRELQQGSRARKFGERLRLRDVAGPVA